jgi:hypothetical protein
MTEPTDLVKALVERARAVVETWAGWPVREAIDGSALRGTQGDLVWRIAAFAAEESGKRIEKWIDWLRHRCDYGPPCGRCTYCSVRLTMERELAARAEPPKERTHGV